MPPITLHSNVKRRPDVVSAEINGELVMMSTELGEYYSLNPVASDIWRRLSEPVTVAKLVQDLTETYAGDPVGIRSDVCALLEGFAAKGLVIVA